MPRISTKRVQALPLNQVGKLIMDEIYKRVNCKQFAIFCTSAELSDIFKDLDTEKVYGLAYLYWPKKTEIDDYTIYASKDDFSYYPLLGGGIPIKSYSSLEGAVAFIDCRTKTDHYSFLLEELFRRCSYVVTFLSDLNYLPYSDKRWSNVKFTVEGTGVQILENRVPEYLDCGKAVAYLNTFGEIVDDFIKAKENQPTQPAQLPPPPVDQVQKNRKLKKSDIRESAPENVLALLAKKSRRRENYAESVEEALRRLTDIKVTPKEERGEPYTEQWVQHFRLYIRDLIKMFYPKVTPKMLDDLTTPDMMLQWIPAFVHISYNPNTGENFEQLESLGDRILGAQFNKYMVVKEPDLTELQLNERKSRYMSREIQYKIGLKMKANEWVLTKSSTVSSAMLEDLFESFSGALQKVGDLAYNVGGYGDILVMQVIETLFSNLKFTDYYDYGNDMTIVDQIPETWRFRDTGYAVGYSSPNGVICYYKFHGPGFDLFMRSFEKIIPGYNLEAIPKFIEAVGEAQEMKLAKLQAAQDMLSKLESYGITRAHIKDKGASRNKHYFSIPEYKNLVDKILTSLNPMGYDELIFKVPKNTSTESVRLYLMIATHKLGRSGSSSVIEWAEFPQVSGISGKDADLEDELTLLRNYAAKL